MKSLKTHHLTIEKPSSCVLDVANKTKINDERGTNRVQCRNFNGPPAMINFA